MKQSKEMRLTLDAARALRDGGIDAVAALNEALAEALSVLPIQSHSEVKHAMGRAMAAVLEETVELAVRAFPELEPDESTWASVAQARAAKRAGR